MLKERRDKLEKRSFERDSIEDRYEKIFFEMQELSSRTDENLDIEILHKEREIESITNLIRGIEKDRIELELDFPYACSCEGVFNGEKLQIEVIGKAAQAVLQKILVLTAKDLGLPVADKRVASETRARILRRGIAIADLSI